MRQYGMTNRDMLKIAMKQSAEDMGCISDDFRSGDNVIVPFRLGANARRYYKLPITCHFVSYGNNIVAAVTDEVADLASEYIGRYEFYHCFETPNMHWLNDRLTEKGYKICFMAEYYLFDANRAPDLSCAYETRMLGPADFQELYLPEWGNALCKDRKHLDVLGVGAYDRGKLVGLAGCSADCEDMWQIGVDVLPEYRRRGIASALTNILAKEIMEREKVPFYCSAWSNIRSVRNAVRSGFIPAWVEMTAKPTRVVDEMNKADIAVHISGAILDTIRLRHSYRGKYKPERVPREHLKAIMEAGLAAPSGCNKQTTSLIAVDDPDVLARIRAVIDPPVAETAPAMICVLSRRINAYRDRCFATQDYAAAIENMLLAITALGYQSCWYEGHITDTDRICDQIARILNVPDEYELVCILPVGIAESEPTAPGKKPFHERAWFNGFRQAEG